MKKWLFTILFGATLVLGACGGGGDDTDTFDNGEDGGDTAETASAGEDAYQDSCASCHGGDLEGGAGPELAGVGADYSVDEIDRKSTRLNSSHVAISYAVFCLKKK